MATTVTLLTSGSSSTDGTQFVTASVSPTASSRVLVFVGAAGNNAATVTVSGLGAEWTNHGNYTNGTNKGILFSAIPVTSSGAVTINATAALTGCTWQVLQTTDGTTPQVIGPYTSTQLGTSGSVTLNAALNANSRPLTAFFAAPTVGEITASALTGGSSTTDGTSFATASVSPVGGSLLAIAVTYAVASGGATTISSVAGLSLTWTMQHRITISASTVIDVWTAPCGATPGSGVITITTAGTAGAVAWNVVQVEGQHGSAPVLNANKISNTGTSTTPNLLLAAPAADNALLFFAGAPANVTQEPHTNWTDIGDNKTTGPSVTVSSQWRRGPTTQSTPTRIKPTNVTQNDMDTAISSRWSTYKTNYLDQNVGNSWYAIDFDPTAAASEVHYVPEGQGYGLLLCVSLAPIDVNAQTYFNGILKFCLDKASVIETRFMGGEFNGNWALVGNQDSATDGDLDIALACILAHKRWGTGTTVNGQTYKHWATERLAGFKTSGFSTTHSLLRLGDWSNGAFEQTSRPSDWMIGHFEQFYNFTGDPFWLTAIDNHLDAAEDLVTDFASSTGLLPDFATGTTKTTLSPGPANVLESAFDDDYYYNACRIPWRMAAANDSRAIARAVALSEWAATKCSNNAATLPTGYQLNGTTLSGGNYQDNAFIGPFTAAAAVDDNQSWLNSCWTFCSANSDNGNYYEDSLGLLAMIQVSQTYWYKYEGELAVSTLSGSAQWATAGLEIAPVDVANSATARANWTELAEVNHTKPGLVLETQWRSDAFETTSSVTTSNVYNILGYSVELAEQTSATNVNPTSADGAGAANGATGKVAPDVAASTATGAANNATVFIGEYRSVFPTVASGTGVAHPPGTIGFSPHIVLAEAFNSDVVVAPGPPAVVIAGSVEASTTSIKVNAICAEATGVADRPHVNGPFSTDATSSSVASDPGMLIKVSAEQA